MRVVRTLSRRSWILRCALAGIAVGVLTVLPDMPASAAASFTEPASDFVGTNQVVLQGTKDSGSALVLQRAGAGVVCTISASTATTWQCPALAVPNGEQTFTGDETLADDSVEPLDPLVLRVLGPPSLNGSGGEVTTTGRFTGLAEPGSSIQLQSSGNGPTQVHSCPPAVGSGFWSCVVALPEGEHEVRARQSLPSLGAEYSTFSPATTATIDRTSPAPPIISSPEDGDAVTGPEVVVSGTGEPDARVQVFTNGDIACGAEVDSFGRWTCTIALSRPGNWTVQALQRDIAGNFSAASARVGITASSTDAGQGNGGSPGSAPPPGSTPNDPDSADSDSARTPSPDPTSPPPSSPAPGDGGSAPPADGGLNSNWGTATGFGGSLPSAEQIVERGGWLIAPLVALAYLVFIALPLRAYATIVGPRLGTLPWRVTGRNRDDAIRSRSDAPGTGEHGADDAEASESTPERPLFSPVVVIVGTFVAAALIAALSGGITAEVRYLRLVAAIGLGLVLINIIGVALPARLAGRLVRTPVVVRLLPGILAVALLAALLSRFLELQPPVLLGVLLTALAVEPARLRARGAVAIAQIAGVATLALISWAAHTLLTPSLGFWMTFAAETMAAIALGGFGSLLVLLLPIRPFPGRELYSISRWGWVAVALTSATITGAIVASGASFPLLALGLIAAATAAVLTALSVWVRWVAPALDR